MDKPPGNGYIADRVSHLVRPTGGGAGPLPSVAAPTQPITLAAQDRARERVAANYRRLRHQHGAERASQIVAGDDPATNADLAAWDRLGEVKP